MHLEAPPQALVRSLKPRQTHSVNPRPVPLVHPRLVLEVVRRVRPLETIQRVDLAARATLPPVRLVYVH